MVIIAGATFVVVPTTVAGSSTSGWSTPRQIDPNAAGVYVSCASASFCTAVDSDGYAVAYNGTSWSAPTNVHAGDFLSVSCASASFCAAVNLNNVFTFNGTWSGPTLIDFWGDLNSVSCASASFCMAVDNFGNTLAYNGASWTMSTSSSGILCHGNILCDLISVSCPSATFCAAVDGAGYALTFDGTSWSAPSEIDNGIPLYSVSCASASFCIAGNAEGGMLTYNDGSWSAPSDVDSNNAIEAVSCPSTSFCAAGDYEGNVFTYNGTSWSAPYNPKISEIVTVSCPSASFCVAAGGYGVITYGAIAANQKPSVTVISTTITLDRPEVPVSLSCQRAACKGTIRLTYSATVKVKRGSGTVTKRETYVLASASYALAEGQRGSFNLGLSAFARSAIKAAASARIVLHAMIVVSVSGGSESEAAAAAVI